jgi:peroxiredoxin Q/BCP
MFRLLLISFFISFNLQASELKEGEQAPLFTAKTQEGADFKLESRKGQWTVLYFYPKAGTPGCTKQACALRDNIKKIRAEGADVYGISSDTVEEQAAFHKEYQLTFPLLADPTASVATLYGAKMPVLKMAKRWTFIIDPELKIRQIVKDVDPIVDSLKIAAQIAALKAAH